MTRLGEIVQERIKLPYIKLLKINRERWTSEDSFTLPATSFSIANQLQMPFDVIFEAVWLDYIDYCATHYKTDVAELMRNAKFGKLISYHRNKKGIGYKVLADMIGVHETTLHEWEIGFSLPRKMKSVIDMANIMGIDKDILIKPLMEETERRQKITEQKYAERSKRIARRNEARA